MRTRPRHAGRTAAGAAIVAILVAAQLISPEAHRPVTAVTWNAEVSAILTARCVGCHAGGGMSFPLDSYEAARAAGASIARAVLQRQMPPWPAAPGFGNFANNPSLTPNEIELLAAWASGGMPRGETATPGRPAASATLAGGAIDIREESAPTDPAGNTCVLELPEDDEVSDGERTFDLTTGVVGERWIGAWEFRPGNAGTVEEADVRVAGGDSIGTWVPPERVTQFPPGLAQRLPAGSRLQVRVAYMKGHTRTTPPRRSSVILFLSARPRDIVRHRWLPCGTTRLARGIELLAIRPSAARAGVPVEAVARRPDGAEEPLCWIHQFRLRYEPAYRFRDAVVLPSGSEIAVRSSEPGCGADLEFTAVRKPTR